LSSRFFAAAIVAVFSLTACQGGAPTTPGTQAGVPAQGQGVIKGRITTAGVIAVSEGHYRTILQAGATVPGAHITVNGGAFNGEATSGADGSFSLTVPGGSAYTITASHPDGQGGMMKQVTVVEVPLAAEPPIVDVASLVTRRTGSIQGVIALSDGADPEGADVFVPGTTMVGKVSAKGRFALANLPEGSWNVVFQKPGYQRAALANLSVQAGKPLVLSEAVTLTKGETEGGSLKALIRDNAGRAVVGASFTATSEAGAAFTAVSDGQGNVALGGLPAGTYRTQVYRSFYQVPAPGTLTIANGEAADAGTVTLNSTVMHFGKIAGQLVDEAGEPVDGAIVQLDPPTTEQVFTDARGNFTLDRVMPGEYTLRASAGGFEVNERTVMVDNQPNFVAKLAEGFVLRAPFDPAKPKPANRPAATLLAPNAKLVKVGNDLVMQWEPVGLPPNVKAVAYMIEAEVAPTFFMPITTTTETSIKLPGFAELDGAFRVTARPTDAPAAYRVAQLSTTPSSSLAQAMLEQAQKARQDAMDSRKSAQELAKLELMNQATTLRNTAVKMQQAAITQLVTSVVQSAVSISASQLSLKNSIKVVQAPKTVIDSKAKIQQLNDDKLAIKTGIGKLPPTEQKTKLDQFQAKSKEAEAEGAKYAAEAQQAAQQAQMSAEVIKAMNEMMQQIINFLKELREAEVEQMKALTKV
jgi:hypothetical protein